MRLLICFVALLFLSACEKDGINRGDGTNEPSNWLVQIGDSGEDKLWDVIVDSNGDVVGIGEYAKDYPGINGKRRGVFMVKTTASGDILWEKFIADPFNNQVFSVEEVPGKGYVFASYIGITCEIVLTDYEGELIKFVAEGKWYNDVHVGKDGRIYALGADLLCFDENLNLLWENKRGGYAVSSTDAGELIVFSSDDEDIVVTNISNTGISQWERTIDLDGTSVFFDDDKVKCDLKVLSNGDIMLCCSHRRSQDRFEKYLCVRLDSNGEVLWASILGGASYNRACCLAELPNGNVVVGGTSNSDLSGNSTTNSNGTQAWMVELDVNGDLLRQVILDGDDDENIMGIHPLNDNEMIIVGWTESSEAPFKTSFGKEDMYIAKVSL